MLTWRDGVTTALAVLVVALALAITQGWDWPLIGSDRTGILVLGAVGIAMCAIGSSTPERSAADDPFAVAGGVLGTLAVVLLVIGLIAGTQAIVVTLAADTLALWMLTTLHHALPRASLGGPAHAAH
jgi:hypothetical protein